MPEGLPTNLRKTMAQANRKALRQQKRRPVNWTMNQDATARFRCLYAIRFSDTEIANNMGISPAVRRWRQRLGLPANVLRGRNVEMVEMMQRGAKPVSITAGPTSLDYVRQIMEAGILEAARIAYQSARAHACASGDQSRILHQSPAPCGHRPRQAADN